MNEIVFFTDGRANWFPGNFNVNVGGGPNQCSASSVSGVYGITTGNSHHNNRVLSLQAPVSPGAPPITPPCPNWGRGQNSLQSIQPIWTPPASPTAGAIFPGGVPLSGFRDTAPNFNQMSPSNGWRQNIAANSVDNLARLIR